MGEMILAENSEDGFFQTFDDGMTWKITKIPPRGLRSLAESHSQPVGMAGREIVYSSDTGISSRRFDTSLKHKYLLGASKDYLFVCTDSGVYRRKYDGVWEQVLTIDATDGYIQSFANVNGKLFISRFGHIYRSDDDGLTWYLQTI